MLAVLCVCMLACMCRQPIPHPICAQGDPPPPPPEPAKRFRHGRGIYREGDYSYEGDFVDDEILGKGRFIFASGAVYEVRMMVSFGMLCLHAHTLHHAHCTRPALCQHAGHTPLCFLLCRATG